MIALIILLFLVTTTAGCEVHKPTEQHQWQKPAECKSVMRVTDYEKYQCKNYK